MFTYITIFGSYFLYKLIKTLHSIRFISGLIDSIKNGDWRWAREAVFSSLNEIDISVLKHPSAMYLLGQVLLHTGKQNDGNNLINMAKRKDSVLRKFSISSSLNGKDASYLRESLEKIDTLKLALSFQKMWFMKPIRYLIISSFVFIFFLHFLIIFLRIFS